MSLKEEINKRKTFAIISHPDAGKTTLTEKLLLFGGAIQVAGAVKSNKIKKTATSDFMEIERQRGISVATSVMAFEYRDLLINLLDTPGHKDFAEDTYRTLSAVDSCIVVIDAAKGVEPQTRRLMEVCRMRKTPVIIFINKLDREAKDPFDLLDELEQELQIKVRPLSWPINMGQRFKGVYDLYNKNLNLFQPGKQRVDRNLVTIPDLNADELIDHLGEEDGAQLREDVEMIEGVYDPLNVADYLDAQIAPVFFGSALNNFGVQEMLDTFVEIAPHPTSREATTRVVEPDENKFSGFIFKIHANLDPRHRDRIAFLRVVSGTFERNKFFHHVRLQKKLKSSNPYAFLAQSKNVVDYAYPGDVIGLYDSGTFKIGDTLSEGEDLAFHGIPRFSPEIFREVVNTDPMKTKQLERGVDQLTDEGVAQLFVKDLGNRKVIGTVGELQFEVIQYRLKNEYGASCTFQPLSFHKACWVTGDENQLKQFKNLKKDNIYTDKEGLDVYFAESAWMLKTQQDNYPELDFHENSEVLLATA